MSWFEKMRRKEKEIKEKTELLEILEKSMICRIAFSDNNFPYIVPMNFCFADNAIYLHSAKEGKKIEIIKKNSNVCFETEYDCAVRGSGTPCTTGMIFRSVIAAGTASIVSDKEKKAEILSLFAEKYTPHKFYDFSEKEISSVAIIKIDISEISGKKSV